MSLKAARVYAKAAAAVPHPAYAVTRLHAIGLSARTAATNLRGRRVSEADVKRAHESDAYRDFHNLTYVEYAYLQWGVITTAQHTVDIIAAHTNRSPTGRPHRTRRSCIRGRAILRGARSSDRWLFRHVHSGWLWNRAAGTKRPGFRLWSLAEFRGPEAAVGGQGRGGTTALKAGTAAAAKLVLVISRARPAAFAKLIKGLQARKRKRLRLKLPATPIMPSQSLSQAAAIEDSIDDLSHPAYPEFRPSSVEVFCSNSIAPRKQLPSSRERRVGRRIGPGRSLGWLVLRNFLATTKQRKDRRNS
jgi:hypothetical protein